MLAMVPTERLQRKIRGKHGEVEFRQYTVALLPGYVFVGAPAGRPLMHYTIQSHKWVWGWVSFDPDGRAAQLSGADIDKVRRLAETERQARGRLQEGDRARLTKGPFTSIEGLATAIRGNRVQVSLQLFGGERTVWVPAGAVEKA